MTDHREDLAPISSDTLDEALRRARAAGRAAAAAILDKWRTPQRPTYR
jgi:hypothetical protein